MTEHRLFDPADPPAWLNPKWWVDTPNCDHLAHPAKVHDARIRHAADMAVMTMGMNNLDEIVDIGAGDGAVLEIIAKRSGFASCGYEIVKDSVRHARQVRGVDVAEANVTYEALSGMDTDFTRHMSPATRDKRLTIATEFFEHLADPHAMVRWLSTRTEWIVASSPWGETPEHHEHNHAWAWDRIGYASLFEDNGFHVVDHQDVEWSQIIVACR